MQSHLHFLHWHFHLVFLHFTFLFLHLLMYSSTPHCHEAVQDTDFAPLTTFLKV